MFRRLFVTRQCPSAQNRAAPAIGGLVRLAASTVAGMCLVGSVLLTVGAQPAAAAKAPITLGFVGDQTGVGASTFGDGLGGAQARIDYQNAHGGVNGHKLKLVSADSQSSPSSTQTAVSDLIQVHRVFGIIEDSAFFFAGDRIAQQAGVPVTGYGIDGPEWSEQPFTNMFDVSPPALGELSGAYHTYTSPVLKRLGVTKLAILANNTPSAVEGAYEAAYAATKEGISICYLNTSLPFGVVDFTSTVLQLKALGCNGVTTLFVDASDIALGQAIKNAGLQSTMKGVLLAEGYDDAVLDNAGARAATAGDYFETSINFTTPNAPTRLMLANLRKYDPSFRGGVPDLGLYSGYTAADLMIYGLEHAGTNPTQATFIRNLRKVKSWNAGGGIFASPTNFTHFGTASELPTTACAILIEMNGTKFLPALGGKPICGKLVAVPPSYSG